MNRHPSIAPIADALDNIWFATALADATSTEVIRVPAFVWGYADVGRKDRTRTHRLTMPLRTQGPPLLTEPPDQPLTATLAGTTATVDLPPPATHDLRAAIEIAETSRGLLWSELESIVTKRCLHIFHQILNETRALPGAPSDIIDLDMTRVGTVISDIALGTSDQPGIVPAALWAMLHDADYTRTDPVRWMVMRVRYRCELAVRKVLGDPRTGSAIRIAAAHGTLDTGAYPAAAIDAALSVDWHPWQANLNEMETTR